MGNIHICCMVLYGVQVYALQEKQMNGCTEQLKGLRADYDYVKDQLTTTEVFYARMYNYSVSQRKK